MSTTSTISTPASYFDNVLQTLQTSGFYWGAINATQSKTLLIHKHIGTFLVRASSDPKHLFTLSLRTESGVTNIRIVMNDGKFSLDQIENNGATTRPASASQRTALRFDCVVKMLFYYMLLSRRTLRQISSNTRKRDRGPTLFLTTPLYKEVSSLQHLCRRTLNRHVIGEGVYKLPIPAKLKVYLRKYQYPL